MQYGYKLPGIKRGAIIYDFQTSESIKDIKRFLDENVKPEEHVYFFPNEPVYYFLFNRRIPTKYVMSAFAITREQRLELIGELEKINRNMCLTV